MSSSMIFLIWEHVSDVLKTILLMCFPCWCILRLLRFIWKCVRVPFVYSIGSSVNSFSFPVTPNGDSRRTVREPPPSRRTVQDIKAYCLGYLIIKILGFKTLILKIYRYFKKLLFGDRYEVEHRSAAKEGEQRCAGNNVPQGKRGAANKKQRRQAAKMRHKRGANEVQQRSGFNEVVRGSWGKEEEQRHGANKGQQGKNDAANKVQQRHGENEVQQRSGIKGVQQGRRCATKEVQQGSAKKEVQQGSAKKEVQQGSGANEVQQRSAANEVQQRSAANEVQQRSGLNGVQQGRRHAANEVLQGSAAIPVQQRTFKNYLTQPYRAEQDTQMYCQGYPGKGDNLNLCDNWMFYSNITNGSNGMSIEQVHGEWFRNYRELESCHDYIQWVFPIRELSMYNRRSQELQPHEAKRIREDPEARQRVLFTYRMMLDFWGMHLQDEGTGEIVRGHNWKERFRHLNSSSHNYLRITRMLKSLGELGFEHFKFPFLSFILSEVFLEKTLINASESCRHYWIHLLRNEEEKVKIRETALEYLG